MVMVALTSITFWSHLVNMLAMSTTIHTSKVIPSQAQRQAFNFQLIYNIVTFKCIGFTHSLESQETLRQVSKLLEEGKEVPVQVVPEPDYQKAIILS